MLWRRTLHYLLLSGLMLPASACDEDSSRDLIERQHDRWRAERPERYVLEVCASGQDDECRRIAVAGEAVVAAQVGSRGTAWTSAGDVSDWEEPIERIFAAAGERSEDCILKQLEFDAKYGFVGEYSYQCRRIADDHGEEVICFVADADSLEACDSSP
jgi:hypothetical protein